MSCELCVVEEFLLFLVGQCKTLFKLIQMLESR